MSEMQLVADHLLIIGQGRILADTSMDDFIEDASGGVVVVASPDAGALAPLLAADGGTLTPSEAGRFEVGGLTADAIGDIAAGHGLRLHQLAPRAASLESAYLELTRDSVEFAAASDVSPTDEDPRRQPHDRRGNHHRGQVDVSSHRADDNHSPSDPWPGDPLGMDQAPHPAQHLDRHGRRPPPAGRPGRDRGRGSTGSVTTPEEGGGFGGGDPLSTVLTGADFAVLLVGVLGLSPAPASTARDDLATIAAVPRRWQVVVSKVIVLTVVVLPTALIGVLAAFGVGMGILSAGDSATVALTDDGVLRSVLGMAGYLTAIVLMGLGLGILLPSAASSIGVLIGGVIVLPTLAGALLPASLDSVLKFLPSSAAAAFTTVRAWGRSSRRHCRSPGPRRLGRRHPRRLRPGDHPSRRISLNSPMVALRLPASPGGKPFLSAEAADLLDAPIGNCQEPLTCEDTATWTQRLVQSGSAVWIRVKIGCSRPPVDQELRSALERLGRIEFDGAELLHLSAEPGGKLRRIPRRSSARPAQSRGFRTRSRRRRCCRVCAAPTRSLGQPRRFWNSSNSARRVPHRFLGEGPLSLQLAGQNREHPVENTAHRSPYRGSPVPVTGAGRCPAAHWVAGHRRCRPKGRASFMKRRARRPSKPSESRPVFGLSGDGVVRLILCSIRTCALAVLLTEHLRGPAGNHHGRARPIVVKVGGRPRLGRMERSRSAPLRVPQATHPGTIAKIGAAP